MNRKKVTKRRFFALTVCLLILSASPAAPYVAEIQRACTIFLTNMFTFNSEGDLGASFERAARSMTPETAAKWREWYGNWARGAKFSKAASSVSVGQIFVSPPKDGVIRVRATMSQTGKVFDRVEEAGSSVILILREFDEGMLVDEVYQETRRGDGSKGVFRLSPAGVEITGGKTGEFEEMLKDRF